MDQNNKSELKDFVIITLVSLFAVFMIRTFIAQPFIVSGASMEPTYHTGEYLIIDQLSYQLHKPERGDVIVFRYPVVPSKFFIKRIIGLPGETVRIEDSNVYIKKPDEDQFYRLEEDYIDEFSNTFIEKKLRDNEYYVMGDNREASLDSRSWGPLEEELIVGRSFIRLYPLNKLGFLLNK